MKIELVKKTVYANKTAVALVFDEVMTGNSERILFDRDRNKSAIVNKLLAYQLQSVIFDSGDKKDFQPGEREKIYWIRALSLVDRKHFLYHLYRDYVDGEASIEFESTDGDIKFAKGILPETIDLSTVEYSDERIEIELSKEIDIFDTKVSKLFFSQPTALDLEYYGSYENQADTLSAMLSRLLSTEDGIHFSKNAWDDVKLSIRRELTRAFSQVINLPIVIQLTLEDETFDYDLDIESFFVLQRVDG